MCYNMRTKGGGDMELSDLLQTTDDNSLREKIRNCYNDAMKKIKSAHIGRFKWLDEPLFLISEQYPGLWLEHVYDSLMLARLEPEYLDVAENAINVFINRQKENGQIPFVIMDGNKQPKLKEDEIAMFSQIQECVSFFSLALEVYEMNRNTTFLEKVYESGKKWDEWLRAYRMTTKRGLIEMFVGFDTGHDNSSRLNGIACKGNYVIDGVLQNADKLPPEDGITPLLAVDMNCNFYGNEKALAKMARILGKHSEEKAWEISASEIKKKLFEHCYDEKDAFFYDVDKNGNKRKYKSCTIFHLFMEKLLDKDTDSAVIERIYKEHIKNPGEFWTDFPFPSMAVNDPSTENHPDFNCWGYYTQGLTVLRCSRWMDNYGYSKDYDYILSKWLQCWSLHYEKIKFAQEIDPKTGKPTRSSEWYSSCMLAYVYAARRLGFIRCD